MKTIKVYFIITKERGLKGPKKKQDLQDGSAGKGTHCQI